MRDPKRDERIAAYRREQQENDCHAFAVAENVRADERKRIVAWLVARSLAEGGTASGVTYAGAAAAIERGDHMPSPKLPCGCLRVDVLEGMGHYSGCPERGED